MLEYFRALTNNFQEVLGYFQSNIKLFQELGPEAGMF
jgi:hypothetical protein